MLKAELLTVLNAEAAQLGVGEVTPSMFDDRVEEGLIGGPTPKGRRRGQNPLWEYSAGTTERALSILRLKAEHVTRFAALRLQLWLRGHELPPSRIEEDLKSEFERLLKRHFFRGLLWSYDARDPTADSFEKRQRHKRKFPPVDSTLEAAGLKPSEDSILALGSKMFWGPDRKTNSFEVLAGELSQKLGGVPSSIVRPFLADLQPYMSCAAGILGNPEEIEKSGLSELDDIEFEDLNNGRIFYQSSVGLFELGSQALSLSTSSDAIALQSAFRKTAFSLRSHDWSVFCFTLGAVTSFRRRSGANNGRERTKPHSTNFNAIARRRSQLAHPLRAMESSEFQNR